MSSFEKDGDGFRGVLDGVPLVIRLQPEGVCIRQEGKLPWRTVPWRAIVELPIAYVVVSDGWAVGRYATETEAMDRVADLRAANCQAHVVREAAKI